MPVLKPGQLIKDYRIVNQIGKGGMASVFKAYQASMGRYVAVKVLSFQLAENDEFLNRFKQEARLIAHLEHPNILPVYDYGEDQGVPFFVMRYLEAGTLKDRFRNISDMLTLDEVDCIFMQLTEALGYAHENGVIHRDIKPSNIMLDRRGAVFLTDFGVAKAFPLSLSSPEGKDDPRLPRNQRQEFTIALELTATGAITGTPDYMSPEQAQGLKLDQRSDIYSLGIVLYEMLTGTVPFEAETPMAVIMKQITEPLPPPSLVRPGLHPLLEAVVQKALTKKPADRYASMSDFRHAWKEAYDIASSRKPVKEENEPQPSPKDVTVLVPTGLPPTDLKPAPWAKVPPFASTPEPSADSPLADEGAGARVLAGARPEPVKGSPSSAGSPHPSGKIPPHSVPSQPAGILHGMEIDHVEMSHEQNQVDNPLTSFRQNGAVKPDAAAASAPKKPKLLPASSSLNNPLRVGFLVLFLPVALAGCYRTQYLK